MGLMGCQKTSVGMYLYRLHNNPLRGGSLKPREARRPRNRGLIAYSGKKLFSYV